MLTAPAGRHARATRTDVGVDYGSRPPVLTFVEVDPEAQTVTIPTIPTTIGRHRTRGHRAD